MFASVARSAPKQALNNVVVTSSVLDDSDDSNENSNVSSNNDVDDDVIQLVSQNKKGELVLCDDALNIIREIKGKIGVFIIVGPYRQGKSSILNRLLEQSNGFKVGHTDNSCTKGIWMWRKPIPHKNESGTMNILYFDTEGIESDDSNSEWDTKIFLLGILLSSMFCYNTKNALTSDATKKLTVMTSISERIKATKDEENNDDDNDDDDDDKDNNIDKSECSDFIWIVRDYSLQSTMTPKERLEKFLEEESTKNIKDKRKLNEINERNEIKRHMEASFNTLDCFYLPCPVTDGTVGKPLEEALQMMDKIPYDKLRNQFRDGMDKLCKIIKERLRPKVINSVAVNGKVFAAYIKQIVENLNSNETIFLSESLIAGIKLAAYESLESVKTKYSKDMGTLSLPKSLADFNKFEADLYKICVDELKEAIIGNNEILNDTLKNFDLFRNLHSGQYREKNSKAIHEFCLDFAKSVWKQKIEPMILNNSFQTVQEFKNHIQAAKIQFGTNMFTNTTEAEESWKKWIENANVNMIERTIEDRQRSKERFAELERQKQEKERQVLEEARKRAEAEKRNEELRLESERRIAEERRRNEELRRDAERRQDEERRRNDELQRQLERQSNSSRRSISPVGAAFDMASLLGAFQAASSNYGGGGGGGGGGNVCSSSSKPPSNYGGGSVHSSGSTNSRSSTLSQKQMYASLPKRADGKPDRRYKAVKEYEEMYGDDDDSDDD